MVEATQDLANSVEPAGDELPVEEAPRLSARDHLVSLTERVLQSRPTPAFLISLILHCALFLLLAFLVIRRQPVGTQTFDLEAMTASVAQEQPTEQLVLAAGESPPPPQLQPQPTPEPPRPTTNAARQARELSHLLSSPAESSPSPQSSDVKDLLSATFTQLSASFAATGIEGRSPKRRERIAQQRGGTLESERAVEMALEWLAAHQQGNGSWSLLHDQGACDGRCPNPGSPERYDPAATGLSLLAFLGAGYTHRDGKHRSTVRKGVYFLMQVMEETNQGGSFLYQSERGMYNHGIAAFALCEAYQMTGDRDLKRAAQQAIDFIATAQSYRGGWGYLPKQPGDLTISGWQVMALKSADAAGLDVPMGTILKLDSFLDTQCVPPGTFYGYRSTERQPTCTSIGLLLRLFRGWPHTDPRVLEGAEYIRANGPSQKDVYFNYYSTLYLFHLGGTIWEQWHPQVRDYLVATQATSGHQRGSWYFEHSYGRTGGRLYTTAMCAMTLEVYYRYAPLYQQADEPFEL